MNFFCLNPGEVTSARASSVGWRTTGDSADIPEVMVAGFVSRADAVEWSPLEKVSSVGESCSLQAERAVRCTSAAREERARRLKSV